MPFIETSFCNAQLNNKENMCMIMHLVAQNTHTIAMYGDIVVPLSNEHPYVNQLIAKVLQREKRFQESVK